MKSQMKYLPTALMVSLYALSAFAKGGYWIGVFPQLDLGNGRRLELQAEYRKLTSDQTLIRPFMTYPIGNNLRGGTGFDIFSAPEFETRIWQEVVFSENLTSPLLATHWRLRQEVRSRSGGGRVRFRTRVMGDLGMTLLSSANLSFFIFDELFFSLSDFDPGFSGIDRNWLGERLLLGIPGGTLALIVFWEHVTHPTPADNIYGVLSYAMQL